MTLSIVNNIFFEVFFLHVIINFFLFIIIGYVQGMSDLLSPILYLMDDEVEAFWCFVGFMEKMVRTQSFLQTSSYEPQQTLYVTHTCKCFLLVFQGFTMHKPQYTYNPGH